MKNYYNVLRIPQDASVAEIEKAYQKLARQYDPARLKGDKYAEERFIDVSLAYKTLADTEKREDYDRILKSIIKGGVSQSQRVDEVDNIPESKVNFRWVAIVVVFVVVASGLFWMMGNRSEKSTLLLKEQSAGTIQEMGVPAGVAMPDTMSNVDVAKNDVAYKDEKENTAPKEIIKEKIDTKSLVRSKPAVDEDAELPAEVAVATQESYTIGTSKSGILNIQGTPTAIAKYNSETEIWFYGKSELHLVNGKLVVAKNIDGNLRMK